MEAGGRRSDQRHIESLDRPHPGYRRRSGRRRAAAARCPPGVPDSARDDRSQCRAAGRASKASPSPIRASSTMASSLTAPSASAILKMKIHKAAIARLFERNDQVLDAAEVYALR